MNDQKGKNGEERRKENTPPILLITSTDESPWIKHINDSGVNFQVVFTSEAFRKRLDESPPPVLLLDMKMDPSALSMVRDFLIHKSLDVSLYVVGLIAVTKGGDQQKTLNAAYEFGVQDFFLSTLDPEVIAHRLRYIYRHATSLQRIRANNRTVLDELREGQAHWIWDFESGMVYVSEGMRFLLGGAPHVRLTNFDVFLAHFSDQQQAGFKRAIDKTKETGDPSRVFQIFSAGNLKGAVEHALRIEVDPETGKDRIKGVAILREDKKTSNKKLFRRDRRTGLPNQDGLILALSRVMSSQVVKDDQFESGFVGLLVVDIDQFKRIAAVYGRDVSRETVRQLTSRFAKHIEEPDMPMDKDGKTVQAKLGYAKAVYLAALGPDEFSFLMTGLDRVDETAQLAETIVKDFAEPFKVKDEEFYMTASMGIAVAPIDGTDAETLLRNARSALTHAKNQTASGYQFFSPALASSARERIELEKKLRDVVSDKKLYMLHQPQVDMKTGEIFGVESLIRWESPDFGSMSPDAFIALIEEVGIISDLEDWVFRESIKEIQELVKKGGPLIQLSVNITAGMFAKGDLHDYIFSILKETGFPPDKLTLEITEGLIMENLEVAAETMKKLKAKGVKVALDDFGTGYSSLSYLKTLPFDYLKIDRSFVKDLGEQENGVAMVRSIIEMAKNLEIHITAEGVETQEQLDILKAEGCDYYQGFLCSKPLDKDELYSILKEKKKFN